jgi:lysophospholipase L1-like esterase
LSFSSIVETRTMPDFSSLNRQLIATAAILVWGLVPGELASGTPARIREAMRRDLPSRADYERMERGYYEQLLDAGRSLDALADGSGDRKGWTHLEAAPFEAGPLCLVVNDVREFVLKPSLSMVHDGATWSTNALGMRDRSYETAKPPGTFRIAFVGDSIGAGWGVNDGEGFEPLLERLLDERSQGAGGPAVEILNFAVPGHGPGQRWEHFTRVGWAMDPDLVLFESTTADPGWDERRLRGLLPRGIGWDSPFYREILAGAKVRPGGTFESYKQALRPFRWEFLAAVYRAAVADCRARGVPCVLVLIPRVGKPGDPAERQRLIALARDAGFAMVADLSDAYDGLDPNDLAIGPRDFHPNADGHARLARRLDAALGRLSALQRQATRAIEEADHR